MDLRQLRTLREVARHGGYTRAARRLGLTQPAVTAQIHTLEKALGVRLFRSVGRRLLLTDEGDVLLRHADRILDEAESAVEAVRAASGTQMGRVAIGASTTPGIYLLPAILGSFRERHPRITVTLEVGNTREIEQRVADADLDVGVVGQEVVHKGLKVERFCDDGLVAIAPPKHPLARRRGLAPRALAGERFLGREDGSATGDVAQAWLRRHGVEIEPVMALNSPEALKHAVAAGLGIAILSEYAVRWEVQDKRVARLDVRGMPIRRPLWLVTRAESVLTSTERALLSHLRRERRAGC
jgi:DNA-binding transcriptional LysR family regulator